MSPLFSVLSLLNVVLVNVRYIGGLIPLIDGFCDMLEGTYHWTGLPICTKVTDVMMFSVGSIFG